jgi:hypothetical protein
MYNISKSLEGGGGFNLLESCYIQPVKKIIPITGLWGPDGSGMLRLPESITL